MLEKGFISHICKISLNKKLHTTPQNYKVLTTLMAYFSELLKFIKMIKNPQTFNENYLIELLHYCPKGYDEWVAYTVRCFAMIRDISNNKDYLAISKIRIGALFEQPGLEKVIEGIVLSKSKEKVAEVLVELARSVGCEQLLCQIVNKLLVFEVLKERQQKCQHLFDMVSLLLDKKMPQYLLDTIRKFVRDVRKQTIIE